VCLCTNNRNEKNVCHFQQQLKKWKNNTTKPTSLYDDPTLLTSHQKPTRPTSTTFSHSTFYISPQTISFNGGVRSAFFFSFQISLVCLVKVIDSYSFHSCFLISQNGFLCFYLLILSSFCKLWWYELCSWFISVFFGVQLNIPILFLNWDGIGKFYNLDYVSVFEFWCFDLKGRYMLFSVPKVMKDS
jgi:hypothetical protein